MSNVICVVEPVSSETSERTPMISIGMPVYDCGPIIEAAIDSLLNQTFRDFELIISDNASADDTRALCERYALADSRIHYIRQPQNIGAISNFNFVLAEARGTYFMWAAADDRRPPDCLEKLLCILKQDSGCALAFSDYCTRNLESGDEQLNRVVPSCSSNHFLNYLIRLLDMCPSLIYGLFRTEVLRKYSIEAFDFSDVHIGLSVLSEGRIRVANECLYIAGTKGVRKPYSLSGVRISRLTFLARQHRLIRRTFGLWQGLVLFGVCCVVMLMNKIRLRQY